MIWTHALDERAASALKTLLHARKDKRVYRLSQDPGLKL